MVIMLLNYTLKLMLLSKVSDMQGNSLYRPYDLNDFNAMRIRFFIKPQRPTASEIIPMNYRFGDRVSRHNNDTVALGFLCTTHSKCVLPWGEGRH